MIRQLKAFRQRRKFRALQGNKKKALLSTGHGLLLIVGIATFVALIFIFAYYVWYLPIEKSMQ